MALLPVALITLAVTFKYRLGVGSILTMIPMCALLYVGGIYWRAKSRALDDGPSAVWAVMPLIHRLQVPLVLMCVAALGIVVWVWISPTAAVSSGDRWTATGAGVLAALEYVNYYHRQLQHFDHMPDVRRFFAGKGFRKSQMARDLRAWRNSQA